MILYWKHDNIRLYVHIPAGHCFLMSFACGVRVCVCVCERVLFMAIILTARWTRGDYIYWFRLSNPVAFGCYRFLSFIGELYIWLYIPTNTNGFSRDTKKLYTKSLYFIQIRKKYCKPTKLYLWLLVHPYSFVRR